VWSGQIIGPWYDAICGATLDTPQMIPWLNTAPEDRCKRCVARLEREEAA